MSEKVICYYHNDMDGIVSASIVKKNYPEAKCVKVNYGDDVKLYMPEDDFEWCIIVDYSFDKDIMELFIKKYNNKVCWIDHHKTAMENNPELWNSKDIDGLRQLDKSGCELTWEWFFPHEEAPRIVELVGDRDMWKFKYGNKTRALHEYLSLNFKEPVMDLIEVSEVEVLTNWISRGNILLDKKKEQVRRSFEQGTNITFEGHKTRVINTNFNISETGEYCYKNKAYPVALIWSVRENKIICSLRSNTIDVSEIAKKHGGGGHKFAAGFKGSIVDIIKWHKK